MAYADALEVVSHALPHVREPLARSRLECRMGRLFWMDGKTSAAIDALEAGVDGLETAGEELEAARYRIVLGRCWWEQSRPRQAFQEFDRARRALEKHGPSAELALAYMRLAGLHKFEMDPRALDTARQAVEVATAAGADYERIWAQAFLAPALFDIGQPQKRRRCSMSPSPTRERAATRSWRTTSPTTTRGDGCTRWCLGSPIGWTRLPPSARRRQWPTCSGSPGAGPARERESAWRPRFHRPGAGDRCRKHQREGALED